MKRLFTVLLVLLLCGWPSAANAEWICDGELLKADLIAGAVDPTGLEQGIPNTLAGTLPGDGVLIRWKQLELQLPRTNNAGAPSYTDGRWWWRVEDLQHPEFLERRGSVITHRCEPL